MDTLQKWDFEKYSQSAAKKALNHNIKHVVKEGGRAGKALMINTHKLISTVQLLGVAGGAAKAAKAISVTTGVMSALFLALDVFFLAKNSHELHKGAKTKFACKIREVCKDLQEGLLELNKVKTQLQKTMDGIEVEEYEKMVEVEVEDDLESDPKKLAELEQELDLLEEKLDKKVEEEKKKKETEKTKINDKKEEPEEKKKKEEKVEESGVKMEKDGDSKKKELKSVKTAKQEVLKEHKGSKKDKETANRITAGEEKHESPQDKMTEDTGPKNTKEEEKNKEEVKSRSGDFKQDNKSVLTTSVKTHSEKVKTERESERSQSSRGDGRWTET